MVGGRGVEAQPGPPQSKTAYVVDRLREEIAAGVIVPGSAVRQIEIARRYGVSPTPVREALRVLEAAGTISYVPNRGATVREMDPADSDDLYALRAEVEGFACGLAAERARSGLVPRLTELVERLEGSDPATDQAAMYDLNRAFHFEIFGTASRVVAQQVSSIWEAFPPAVTVWGFPAIAKPLHRDHRRIVAALAAGDPDLARRRMTEHVLHARTLRRRHLG